MPWFRNKRTQAEWDVVGLLAEQLKYDPEFEAIPGPTYRHVGATFTEQVVIAEPAPAETPKTTTPGQTPKKQAPVTPTTPAAQETGNDGSTLDGADPLKAARPDSRSGTK